VNDCGRSYDRENAPTRSIGLRRFGQYIGSRSAFKQQFGYPELDADDNVNDWAHG
jgi:hypothetical protein